MDNKKPVENILEETLKNLKEIIDVDLIIGKAINYNETTVIPVSKVSVGFVSGGGEYANNKKIKKLFSLPFAGGSGGGCSILPIGFLVISGSIVNFIKVDDESNFKKFVDITTDFVESIKK